MEINVTRISCTTHLANRVKSNIEPLISINSSKTRHLR